MAENSLQSSLGMSVPTQCVLDSNSCVKLSSIVESFSAPINEEHAWAVCYQAAKCLQKEWAEDKDRCYLLTDLSHVLIHKDGSVHPSTARPVGHTGSGRTRARTEYDLSSSLGLVIFRALDYGVAEDEERHLSGSLENLITVMTSVDPTPADDRSDSNGGGGGNGNGNGGGGSGSSDNDEVDRHEADEGIERDSGEDDEHQQQQNGGSNNGSGRSQTGATLTQVLELCTSHLSIPGQADSHYKAVCRAFVAEALELSTFLQKISEGTAELKHLRLAAPDEPDNSTDLKKLHITDWARLWVQVIRELRQGVKLKKVVLVENNPHHPPIEYELTPYEILMDDIRSRRYKLNKVMVNGDIPPKVKKDAHAIILEFIRSRPPLHPVAERKLNPLPPKPSSPYEQLMKSIRQEQYTLKPTPTKQKTVETSRTKLDDNDSTPQPTRRLIKADLSLLQLDNFDEEDEEYLASPSENGHHHPGAAFGFEAGGCSSNSHNNMATGTPANGNAVNPSAWQRTVALDLATNRTSAFKPERRHSITVCESPTRPSSMTETQWKNSMECLSLSLEEVVHIRNVLTKAELEGLLVDRALYEEVSKGKICFTCKKTRFSFFGQWGQKCRLCKRNVCERCCTKMNIPTEHFASVPVFTLSPGSSSSSGDDESPRSMWRLPDMSRFISKRMSVGSAPSSPNLPSKHIRTPSVPNSVGSTPVGTPTTIAKHSGGGRRPLLRSRTLNRADTVRREQLRGELMNVCKECRAMVRHAIVANRQSLNLNKSSSSSPSSVTSRGGAAGATGGGSGGDGTTNGCATRGAVGGGGSGGSSTQQQQQQQRQPNSRDLHLNLSPIY